MKSLNRALTLLTELSTHEPSTLADLSNSVGLHKSTVHRMLATFIAHGLVMRDETNRYVIGPRAMALAEAASGLPAMRDVVEPAVMRLGSDVGEAAFYAVPGGSKLRCVVMVPGAEQERRAPRADRVALYHTTALGKAYLAYRPRHEIAAYVERAPFPAETPFSMTDSQTLIKVLHSVRRRGYATENRESHPLVRRVGTAVLDRRGHAVAAVATDVPLVAGNERAQELSEAVLSCAASIEDGLFGHAYPRVTADRTTEGSRGGMSCLPT
jgi:DNA-binding IclR family transcriptional regulator